jgi:hypothetical protein
MFELHYLFLAIVFYMNIVPTEVRGNTFKTFRIARKIASGPPFGFNKVALNLNRRTLSPIGLEHGGSWFPMSRLPPPQITKPVICGRLKQSVNMSRM